MILLLRSHGFGRDSAPQLGHGKHFIAADRVVIPPPVSPGARQESGAQLQLLADRMKLTRLQRGAYDAANTEDQMDLGRYLDAAGDYESAVLAFGTALHLLRINEGLYSPAQRPVVRALLDSIRRSGDLQALDDRYGYLFRLYGAGQPPYTEVRLRVVLEYLRWQREALALRFDKDTFRRLTALYDLNQDILEHPTMREVGADWRLQLIESQLLNVYIIQSEVKPPVEVVYGSTRKTAHAGVWQSSSPGQQDLNLDRILRQRQSAVHEISAQLERFINEPEQDPLLRSRAQLLLGDFRQWSGQRREAKKLYGEVYDTLLSLGDEARLQAWFAHPVPLPDAAVLWSDSDHNSTHDVQVNYDVDDRGEVRNVQVLDNNETAISDVRVRRHLMATPFRPRYAESGPVLSEGLTTTFRFRE